MLSILLGHSYFLCFDQKQSEREKPYPPLATLQVADALRSSGHQVAFFDAMLAEGTHIFDQQLRAVQPQLVVLYEDNFNYLSKMCLGSMRRAACEMIQLSRRNGARVLVAGSDASDAPEPYLRAGAEVVLFGEGLSILDALLARLDSDPKMPVGALIGGLSGLAVLDEGVQSVRGVSLLPVAQYRQAPAWDLVDIERYRSIWLKAHGYFSMNMAASRGCSFRCAWCAKPIWGNQYLQRAPTAVAAEMARLKHSFGVDHVWFADDIFGFRVSWVDEFAGVVRSSGGGIPFTVQTRADLISEQMAESLREAGCREAWIGAESGSQRVLDAMNKGITVAETLTARARLKSAGIRVGFFIQLGYLDEQLSDILATRSLLDTAVPDDVGVSVSYPLPGTKFYELVKAQLQAKTHWQESDDLEMMFRGTYKSEFYRTVRDLLHARVELEKLSSPSPSEAYRAGHRALKRRWQHLLGAEQQYRNEASWAAPAASDGGRNDAHQS